MPIFYISFPSLSTGRLGRLLPCSLWDEEKLRNLPPLLRWQVVTDPSSGIPVPGMQPRRDPCGTPLHWHRPGDELKIPGGQPYSDKGPHSRRTTEHLPRAQNWGGSEAWTLLGRRGSVTPPGGAWQVPSDALSNADISRAPYPSQICHESLFNSQRSPAKGGVIFGPIFQTK